MWQKKHFLLKFKDALICLTEASEKETYAVVTKILDLETKLYESDRESIIVIGKEKLFILQETLITVILRNFQGLVRNEE